MRKFDLIYEQILFQANGLDVIVENINRETADLVKFLDDNLISEGVWDSIKDFFKTKVVNAVKWIWEGMKKAVSAGGDMLRKFIKAVWENKFVKGIIDKLFGSFIKSNKVLNADKVVVKDEGSDTAANSESNDNQQKPATESIGFIRRSIDSIILEDGGTITLTQEQFNSMVNGMAEDGAKKAKSGVCGKICGFIVDHFFGLVKILALVAVGAIFIFKPEWAKMIGNKITEWISKFFKVSQDKIAEKLTNAKEIADEYAKPLLSKGNREKIEAAATDTSKDSEVQSAGVAARTEMLDNYKNQNNAAADKAEESLYGQAGNYNDIIKSTNGQNAYAMTGKIWLLKMHSMWESLGKPTDRVGQMTSYVKDKYPKMFELRDKYWVDIQKSGRKYSDDDARKLVERFKYELDQLDPTISDDQKRSMHDPRPRPQKPRFEKRRHR
jgi:hypothetical protein